MGARLKLYLTLLIITGLMSGCSDNEDKNSSSLPESPAPPVIATPGSTLFDFESDLESWQSERDELLTVTHNTNTAYVLHGFGSIRGECNITGIDPGEAKAVFRYDPLTDIDMSGLILQFYIYIPDSLANLSLKYGSKLWLGTYNEEGWDSWSQMEGPEIDTAGWNHFTFSPSGIEEDAVRAVALQIYKDDGDEPDWAGDIYFDYISW